MSTHSHILACKKAHGQRSLAGCSQWGHEELDMTEDRTHINDRKMTTTFKNINSYSNLLQSSKGLHYEKLNCNPLQKKSIRIPY